MPASKTELMPLKVIRSETVLSKLPVHNLSGNNCVSIQITRKNEQGKAEVYWEVTANAKYGLPGQLAYKIDTIIVNRRIDELARPLPIIIRLGSLSDLCRMLGLRLSGQNIANIRKAMLQNATSAITAKFSYKDKQGGKKQLEAAFTRYGVAFTGETLPNGERADAVYIILSEPYLDVLNNAPFRPLDYEYLKSLTPSAQRFYEIISYRIFFAIKYEHEHAQLLYSEYCAFSAQTRYFDYEHFKKQMYKIHKPHLDSDYLKQVNYEKQTDAKGKADWLMLYTPGTKARAEYRAFNGKQLIEDEVIDITPTRAPEAKKAKAVSAAPSKRTRPTTSAKTTAKESKSEPSAALALVQSFHKQARSTDNYQPYRGSKETSQAEALLATHGDEKAQAIISFAIAQSRKTNFEMRTFGAIFQYVDDAIAEHEHREQELARRRTEQEAQRQAAEQRLQALSKREYRALYEKAKKQILSDIPSLASHQEGETCQSLIKAEMIKELDRPARKKEK